MTPDFFAYVTAAVLAITVALPRIMAMLKRDQLDNTTAATQITVMHSLDERIMAMEKRITDLSALVHDQQIKITKLSSLLLRTEMVLQKQGVSIPAQLQEEIRRFTAN
jgi:uncharacterized coiled-coil protein SlyX